SGARRSWCRDGSASRAAETRSYPGSRRDSARWRASTWPNPIRIFNGNQGFRGVGLVMSATPSSAHREVLRAACDAFIPPTGDPADGTGDVLLARVEGLIAAIEDPRAQAKM